MNGDLISRSALLDEMYKGTIIPDDVYSEGIMAGVDYAIKKIEAASAVDAVALPCKVGDTVWGIRNYRGISHPQQGKVDQMYYTDDMRLHIKVKHICIGEWGKKIFPTREEAEVSLKRRADDAD